MKNLIITRRDIGLFIVLVIFSTACGSSSKRPSKAYTVEIRQMKFEPSQLVLQKGDTVVFVNRDLLTHDVTETPGKNWTSTPLSPNASWTMIAEKTSDYYCSIHPVMKGKLVVQ